MVCVCVWVGGWGGGVRAALGPWRPLHYTTSASAMVEWVSNMGRRSATDVLVPVLDSLTLNAPARSLDPQLYHSLVLAGAHQKSKQQDHTLVMLEKYLPRLGIKRVVGRLQSAEMFSSKASSFPGRVDAISTSCYTLDEGPSKTPYSTNVVPIFSLLFPTMSAPYL